MGSQSKFMSKTLTMYIVYISGYTIKVAFNLKPL